MENNPGNLLVSVIIPVFNGDPWLNKAIESVKAQTYENWELLIINDGSTDQSSEIAQTNEKSDKRIRVIDIEHSGLSIARNNGLKNATGEYIAFLDADDEWSPNKLKLQVDFLYNNPQILACVTQFAKINETGQIIKHWSELEKNYPLTQITSLDLAGRNLVAGSASSVMMAKGLVEKVGYFEPGMSHTEDLNYWYRASFFTPFIIIPEVCVYIRRHGGGMHTNKKAAICGKIKFVALARKIAPKAHKKVLDQIDVKYRLRLAAYYWNERDLIRTLLELIKLIVLNPIYLLRKGAGLVLSESTRLLRNKT